MVMNIDFKSLLSEMELNDRARGLTDKSIKKNNKFLNMFFKYLDDEFQVSSLNQLRAVHIKMFMAHKKNEGSAETYVNSFLRSIRAICLYAENEEYMTQQENPTLRVKWMKEQKKLVKSWSDEDVEKMLKYTDQSVKQSRRNIRNGNGKGSWFIAERNKFLIMLLADTGIRISELENLYSDDFTERDIFIHRGKGKKDRVVYSSPKVMKQKLKYERAKKLYFEARGVFPDSYLFVSRLGDQLTNDAAEIVIRKIGVAAGCDPSIRMSPHTFRHYFTQKQLDLGTSIYDIQRLLGHSSIQTTETYLRSISSDKVLKRGLINSPLMNLRKKN